MAIFKPIAKKKPRFEIGTLHIGYTLNVLKTVPILFEKRSKNKNRSRNTCLSCRCKILANLGIQFETGLLPQIFFDFSQIRNIHCVLP